jgi:ABC-type phosphate/phosphonate transport system substrate-binding protein
MGAAACRDGPVPQTGETIMLGCIDYTDQIRTIWDGIRQYFLKSGIDFDFVLFTNYERQVEALINGSIDIAWNGPLAHVRTKKRTQDTSLSLGMRDVDCGFVTRILVRKSAGIRNVNDLNGKRLALGTRDSPQSCVLPMQYLKSQGVKLETITAACFDRDLGKHGDTALGEIEVMNELAKGKFDAGCVSDMMFNRALASGDINNGKGDEIEILRTAEIPRFSHCQFDALRTLDAVKKERFVSTIFGMDYSKPDDRRVMQLEGIKERWEKADDAGYRTMYDALADEPNVPYPPPMYREENHPFYSFSVFK